MTAAEGFASAMGRLLDGGRPDHLAAAVSGGSDSMALLALAINWIGDPARVTALTVDHGLRPESADEARFVADQAAAMGAAHETLIWEGWDGRGNLQAAARDGRRALLKDWQTRHGGVILLGHTMDDQAETLLMRLARGSGVDGLAGIPSRSADRVFLRPLLGLGRDELRADLIARSLRWIEDPSNRDERFDRVRMRKALELLAPLGIDAERLAATADAQARAREALKARAADVADTIADEPLPGVICFDREGLEDTEAETTLRLLAHALRCLSSSAYRPRLSALEPLLAGACAGRGGTLHGALVHIRKSDAWVVREPSVVEALAAPADGAAFWDGRWRIRHPDRGAVIRPLGEAGLSQFVRPDHLPRAALISYPGVWRGAELLAVPGLMADQDCAADYLPSAAFHRTILSH